MYVYVILFVDKKKSFLSQNTMGKCKFRLTCSVLGLWRSHRASVITIFKIIIKADGRLNTIIKAPTILSLKNCSWKLNITIAKKFGRVCFNFIKISIVLGKTINQKIMSTIIMQICLNFITVGWVLQTHFNLFITMLFYNTLSISVLMSLLLKR